MKFKGINTGQFIQLLSLIIGSFSVSIACLAVYKANKNTRLLKKINRELNLENQRIVINSDRWIKEKIAMRKALREETRLPKAKRRFLTG